MDANQETRQLPQVLTGRFAFCLARMRHDLIQDVITKTVFAGHRYRFP
jgi:hypothetical protein